MTHQLITDGYGVNHRLITEGYFSSDAGMLTRILTEMKKKSLGDYCFEPDCAEPGVDNCNVLLRRILSDTEKNKL